MIGTVAVVGANLAGVQTAAALRTAGFDGHVIVIGEEPWLAYQRPLLSKDWLHGDGVPPGFELRGEDWYREQRIDLVLDTRVTALDRGDGAVELADGRRIAADRIVLATGARARKLDLPGAQAENVFCLRTRADADALRAALNPGAAVVVIGMGVIGAEVAASAVKRGCLVATVEPGAAAMLRTLGSRFGSWLADVHRRSGVASYYGTGVAGLVRSGKRVCAVVLADGTRLDADAVVVGIGVDPNVELAAAAGLQIDNGIVVDAQARTSDPRIWAAGDVSNQPGFFGGRVRLETFRNAADQAEVAAAAILGASAEYAQPCWFWSDQYDLNIQVAGRIDDTTPVVVRGAIDDDAGFTALFLADGVVEGVLTVNRGADMAVGRRMVARRMSVDAAQAADPQRPLKALL